MAEGRSACCEALEGSALSCSVQLRDMCVLQMESGCYMTAGVQAWASANVAKHQLPVQRIEIRIWKQSFCSAA